MFKYITVTSNMILDDTPDGTLNDIFLTQPNELTSTSYIFSLANELAPTKFAHSQGSHSDWKTWKNRKAFSSQGKVREF